MLLYSNALPDSNYTITGVGGSGTGVNIPTGNTIIEQPAPSPTTQTQVPGASCSGCKPGTATPTVTPGTSASVPSGMATAATGPGGEQLAGVVPSGENYGLLLLLLALGFATYHAVKERKAGR